MVDVASAPNTRPAGAPPGSLDTFDLRWPSVPPPPALDGRKRTPADLAALIQSEIIPRLMLTHGRPAAPAPDPLDGAALDAFVRMTLESDASVLTAHVEDLVCGGVALERTYRDLLAPAARRLGDDWNADVISFTDVTIGLSRLHQVVRRLARSFPVRETEAAAPSACFVASPGEQHTFGLLLLEDAFRRAGWRTWLDAAAEREDAVRAVSQDHFDVFGVSATSDTPVRRVAEVIAAVRRRSLNPRLFVLVGGRLFIDNPELAAEVGADAAPHTAADALSAAGAAVKRPALA